MHIAVDTLGHLLALAVTPANQQDREQVGQLAEAVQAEVEEPVKVAFVDQGYTGEKPMEAAAQKGIELLVVKHHQAKRGFVLLPRRWVVERSFAWLGKAKAIRGRSRRYDLQDEIKVAEAAMALAAGASVGAQVHYGIRASGICRDSFRFMRRHGQDAFH